MRAMDSDEEKAELLRYNMALRKRVANLELSEQSEREQLWQLRLSEANKVIDKLRADLGSANHTARVEASKREERHSVISRETTERIADAFRILRLELSGSPDVVINPSRRDVIHGMLRRAEEHANGSRIPPTKPPVAADSPGRDRGR
jgi:hypothetical protein